MTSLQKQVLLGLARGLKNKSKEYGDVSIPLDEMDNLLRAVDCLASEVLSIVGERDSDTLPCGGKCTACTCKKD